MKLQLLRNEGEFKAYIHEKFGRENIYSHPKKYPCFVKGNIDVLIGYLYQEDLERMLGEIKAMIPEPKPNGKEMPGVWCCEHRLQCKWQGFALNQGLGWGTIPPLTNEWRKWHDRECGGRLIQLVPERGWNKMKDRIAFLEAELKNDSGETIDVVSKNSFIYFIDFLDSLSSQLPKAMVSLTPDNEIYAKWVINHTRYSFRFCRDGQIRYVRLPIKEG